MAGEVKPTARKTTKPKATDAAVEKPAAKPRKRKLTVATPENGRPLRFAGTPTHNRPEMYAELRANLDPQVDHFITVAHNADYATGDVLTYTEDLPDLGVMWNMILDRAHELAKGRPYYVAILNDDTQVADDWFERMVDAIESNGSAGASTPRAPGKPTSIFGGGFVVNGAANIRMSGKIRWWYTDDEIQKLCERAGGFTIVDGVLAVNRLANQSTRDSAELQAINSEDWPVFNAMYGMPASPWNNTEYHVVISAPSGKKPTHIIDTLNGRPYTILWEGWETDQLREAANRFGRFVFIKESVRLKPGFWEAIDSEKGSCWLFARPSCYMGIYDAPTLKKMLDALGKTTSKEDSIRNEWLIHGTVQWRSIWPEIHDYNALRMDGVELVIGNHLIEKLKGTARCGLCANNGLPGVCEHLKERAAR